MKNFRGFFLMLAAGALIVSAFAPARAFAEEAPKKGDGKKEEGADKKPPDGATGGRFAGDPIYVHITPMVLPVINENGVEQLVTLIMDVEVKDFDAADAMHSHMPKIMDSLMRKLYGGLGSGALRNGKIVDVTRVKNKAIAAIGDVIGPGNVRDVLIQSVAQRML